jgi:hypothetical protein
MCLRLDLYMSNVLLLCIIIFFTRIDYTLLTCDIYQFSLRHINDPVLSSLNMEGIRFFYVISIKCNCGGIRETCSPRCED